MGRRDQQPIPDPAASPVEAEQPVRAKSKVRILIMVMLILLPAGGGAVFAYSQYGPLAQWITGTLDAQAKSTEKENDQGAEPIEYGLFYELGNLIVNPRNTNGQRYLIVSIGFESKSNKVLEELKAKEVVVRDTTLKLLGFLSVDELADIDNRSQIKEDLRQAVNALVQEGVVDRVYFTQYVLQ